MNTMKTAHERSEPSRRGQRSAIEGSRRHGTTPWVRLLQVAALCWGALGASAGAQAGGSAQVHLERSEIVEYWLWASGVAVSGTGFAPSTTVDVTITDPNGGTRPFAAPTDAAGAFNTRVNAMKIRSVLGTHQVSAVDPSGGNAQASLSVVRDPDEVLNVTAGPAEMPLTQFASGTRVHIGGLTPNGRVRINLADPADNIGELMVTTPLFADANGAFDFLLDPKTEIWGFGVVAIVPTEGVWMLSAHGLAGGNELRGSATFRLLPDAPSPNAYCAISMTQQAQPITRVRFAGIDKASAADSPDGYENFTSTHGAVTAGRTYTMRLKGKADQSFEANTYTVFFDWNRNGVLDEPNEIYSAGSLIGSTGSDGMEVVYDVAVPGGAQAGPTRMRVLKVYSPSSFSMYWPSGGCGSYRAGQVEDYTVDVVSADAVFANGFETGATAVAPTLRKNFAAPSVATNTPMRLTITLANANATPATLTSDLVDVFPNGLVSAAGASTTCIGGPGIAQTGASVTLSAGASIPAAGSCTIALDVAATVAGNLTNTIPAGGLVTDAGTNANAATATVAAVTPPTLTKNFAVPSIATNTPTRLTITLANTNPSPATLTSDLVDAFPNGLVSAANASTTCIGGPGITQTGTSVTLRAGAAIPAAGSCTIALDVAATVAGSLTNTIPTGGLVTNVGSNASAAAATLTATSP
ncbi:hypothetical protein DFR29_103344 [Tahibacter aquaticus]|uniref:Repeat protein (TIGR01451 family) n=1 Tax=Tahibacter aquaticus TaxID=520092 RepID=A0A4R6Z527_9GAMM|nr:GEVED domain-containing protein [Tahibacter aquaticus]TDR46808.1 hypothetical protein DFR29_103344 [Tahibacter aquaticus]